MTLDQAFSGLPTDPAALAGVVQGLLMHEHIALEESLIYPLSRAVTPSDERAAMRREMEARRGLSRVC